jgi:predicted dehydrogenase
MTVYGLHSLTGVLGPAQRVTALSGTAITEREYQGQIYPTDAHDNTLLLLDFGNTLFAFVYGTAAGTNTEFGLASYYGTTGKIEGLKYNGEPLHFPGCDSGLSRFHLLPHVTGEHRTMGEAHVFEDVMQLVDLVLDGTPTLATPEHARHVIEIIEAATGLPKPARPRC